MGYRVTWLLETELCSCTINPHNKTFILSRSSWVRHWIPASSLMVLLQLKAKSLDSDATNLLSHLRGFQHHFSLLLRPSPFTGHAVQFVIRVASRNSIAVCIFIFVLIKTWGSHRLLTVALVRVRETEINLHSRTLFSSKWQRCNCTWMRRQGYAVVWCFLFKICRKVNQLCTSIHAASTRKMLLGVIIAADIDGNWRGDGGVP